MSDDLLDELAVDVGIAEKPNHLRRFKSAVATKKSLEKEQTESISKTDKSSLSKSKFLYLSTIHFGHSGCVCLCVANDITIMHYLYLSGFQQFKSLPHISQENKLENVKV